MDEDVLYGDIAIALGYVRREQLVAHSHRAWMARQRGQTIALRNVLLEANTLTAAQDARIMRMVEQRATGSVTAPPPRPKREGTAVVDAVMIDAGDGVAPNVTLLQVQLDSGIAEAFSSTNSEESDQSAGVTLHGATATRPDRYGVTLTVARDEAGDIAWAHDKALLREVSIATLHRTDEVRRARFAAEAQLVCELDHPNVPLIHEVGVDPHGQPFVVTARARGCPLTAVLAATAEGDLDPLPLTVRRATTELENQLRAIAAAEAGSEMAMSPPVPDATEEMPARRRRQRTQSRLDVLLDIFSKVCEVVEHAHAHGVIHRDLKPDNILVGERGDITVIEWSLARRIDQLHQEGPASLTKTEAGRLDTLGAVTTVDSLESPTAGPYESTDGNPATTRYVDGPVAGTPAYMSPEAANGQLDRLTPQSDVYSLGATLLHILGCAPPVEGDSVASVLRHSLMGDIPPLRGRSKAPWRVLRELEAIALKAMARTPADRYESAAALEADIVAWRRARRDRAAGFPSLRLLRAWASRRPLMAIASAVACLLCVIALVVAVVTGMDTRVNEAAALANADVDATLEARRAEREQAMAEPDRAADEIAKLREDAQAALAGQPDAASLASAWTSRHNRADARKPLLIELDPVALHTCRAAYLSACALLDQALGLADRDDTRDALRAERAAAGRGLGYVALFSGDAVLAERTFDDLRDLGVNDSEVGALIAAIDSGDDAHVDRDVTRLREMLTALDDPAPRETFSAVAMHAATELRIDALVREVAAFNHDAAVKVLAEALDPLRELADRRGDPWFPTRSERTVATFCLRALGVLGASVESAMRPLYDFAEAVFDASLAIEAGHALCDTGRATARRSLLMMWARFGSDSDVWRAIAPHRVSLPIEMDAFNANVIAQIAAYERACSDGDATAARNALDALINRAPDDVTLRLERAGTMIEAGDPLAADPDLAHVRKLELNNNGIAAYLSARSYLARDEHTAADMWGTNALRLVSHVPDVWRTRAEARRPAQPQKALDDLDNALALTPFQSETWLLRVRALRDLGDLIAVIADLDRALTFLPTEPQLWYQRALAYADLDNFEQTVADATQALALDPAMVEVYELRGAARGNLGLYEEGIEDLDRAVRTSPDGPSAVLLYNRGLANLEYGDARAALEDLRAVSQSPSGDWATRANLALALSRLGDIDAANLEFERAAELLPNEDAAATLERFQANTLAAYESWNALPELPTPIANGLFKGTLVRTDDTTNEAHTYDRISFEGRQGQRLRVRVRSAAFDPYLTLRLPSDDQSTHYNNDITPGIRDAFLDIRLTEDGLHTVFIFSAQPNQLGRYTVEFELLGP